MDSRNVKHPDRAWTRLVPCAVEARRFSGAAAVLCMSFLLPASSVAGEPAQADQVVEGFLEACGSGDWLSEAESQKAREIVTRLRADQGTADAAITEALRAVCPEFAVALEALSGKDVAGAVSGLRPLAAAENPYLAAESTFFLARAHAAHDDYEQALPLLEELMAKHSDHSLHLGEATFLRGVCQMHLLRRVEATASFAGFLQHYPSAPAPILDAAKQNLELLEQLEPGSLDDVHDHTEYSYRRLSLARSGKETQEVQDHIVAMLTSLIDEMEKCRGGKCSGCSRCQGGQKSGGGQGGPTPGISSGTSTAARRVLGDGAKTAWADLKNKASQTRAFTAVQTRFPARYRQLVEQYYRSLHEESEP